MSEYYAVNKEVLPLKQNLAVQEGELARADETLNDAQKKLDEKKGERDAAQKEYDDAMREKQTLVEDAAQCKRKMEAATQLINGLSGEKERWTEQSEQFQDQRSR